MSAEFKMAAKLISVPKKNKKNFAFWFYTHYCWNDNAQSLFLFTSVWLNENKNDNE
jgi:hypothetical protein